MSMPEPRRCKRRKTDRLPLAFIAYAMKCGTPASALSTFLYAVSIAVPLYT